MFDMNDDDEYENLEEPDPRIEKLFERLKDRAEDVGLYMQTAVVVSDDHDPDSRPLLAAMFAIGDRAYDPTTTDETERQMDTEWRKLAQSEVDMMRQQLIEELGDRDDEE